jgi:mRNA-degrading endonuclease toxin of MazEF toxin-antitoxin module
MRQWDIYLFPFEEEKPHPAVIISNDERCLNDALEYVNALICTSAKLNREAKRNEIILNSSDGLDWKTAVRCDVIYLLPKAEFKELRGRVTTARRIAIARKVAETLRFRMA